MSTCLFCDIVAGVIPSHKVWEDENHLAFLSIFPNTEGVTVVIPKAHYDSYAFALPDTVLSDLVIAAKKVAGILDAKLPDVGRTALVFEGFGVDHVHAKLFPMHGTADMTMWKPIESSIETYFKTYPGYISSHDAGRADDAHLATLAERLRA
jgi:diadenosine tetraphosphate (Ap4A) HIT family hydrolase